MLQTSFSLDLPLIAGQEVFYLEPNMAEAHDALICIKRKRILDDKNRFRYSNQHYLKDTQELEKIYKDIPEALENNYNFPRRFNFKPNKSKPILPSISNDKETSAEKELLRQAEIGLENRLKNFILKKNNNKSDDQIKSIYNDRLLHEIEIINSMNYSSYFLIVSDYIKWAKKFYSSWTRQRIRCGIFSGLLFGYY